MGNSASTPNSEAVLQAYFERQLKRAALRPRDPPYVSMRGTDGDDDNDDGDVPPEKPDGGLPAPPTEEDVATIGQLAAASKTYLDDAKSMLEGTSEWSIIQDCEGHENSSLASSLAAL